MGDIKVIMMFRVPPAKDDPLRIKSKSSGKYLFYEIQLLTKAQAALKSIFHGPYGVLRTIFGEPELFNRHIRKSFLDNGYTDKYLVEERTPTSPVDILKHLVRSPTSSTTSESSTGSPGSAGSFSPSFSSLAHALELDVESPTGSTSSAMSTPLSASRGKLESLMDSFERSNIRCSQRSPTMPKLDDL